MGVLTKILSGTHEGAEFLLTTGTYILGSGEEADLFLVDALLRPSHARFVVDGDSCRVEPVGGAEVRVDGVPIDGPVQVAMYGVVTVGGVNLAVGPEGQWERMPAIPTTGTSSLAEPLGRAVQSRSPESGRGDEERPRRRRGYRRVVWPAAILLAVCLGVWFAATHGLGGPAPGEREAAEAAAALRAGGFPVLHPPPSGSPPAGTVAVRAGPDGGVLVYGLLAGDQARRAVLSAPGLPPDCDASGLATVEEDVEAAAGMVAGRYPGLGVEQEPGRFFVRLTGVARQADAAEAYRAVKAAIDPRIAVRQGIHVWPELRRELERDAAKIGLADLTFELADGRLVAHAENWPEPRLRSRLVDRVAERSGANLAALVEDALAVFPPEPAVEQPPEPEPPAAPPVVIVMPAEEPPPPESPPEPPADEPAVEAEHSPEAEVEAPPEEPPEPEALVWRIARISDDGFFDQNDIFYRNGDYLSDSLRLVSTWSEGVVIQRNNETIFIAKGAVLLDQ